MNGSSTTRGLRATSRRAAEPRRPNGRRAARFGLAALLAVAGGSCLKEVDQKPSLEPASKVQVSQKALTAGTWTVGTTKTAVAGNNRALIVTVHTEGGATTDDLAGVTYGGQAMTEIEDEGVISGGNSAYVAIYILREAKIAAATSSTIAATWLLGPGTTPTFTSAFFTDVDQATPFGDARTAAVTTTSVATQAVATAPGDIVIAAATNGGSGTTFTPGSGYTEQLDAAGASAYRYMVAQKVAAGTSETPSTTVSATGRTAMVAFTLKAAVSTCTPTVACGGAMQCGVDSCGTSCGTCPANQTCSGNTCNACVPTVACGGAMECGVDSCGTSCGTCTGGKICVGNTCSVAADVAILGTWTAGASHAVQAGTNRALVVAVHDQGGTTLSSLSGVTFGGQAMTKIDDLAYLSGSGSIYTAIYALKETGIAAASGSTIALTWATGPGGTPTITSAFFGNVNQTNVYTGAKAKAGTTSGTVSTTALLNNSTDMVIFAASNGNSGATFAPGNSFSEQLDAALSGFRHHVAQKRGSGSSETPSTVVTGGNRTAMVAFVLPGGSGGAPPPAPTCSDGVKNGTETGTDCGGSCTPCGGETYITVFFTASGDQPINFAATEVTSTLTALPGLTPNANKTLAQLGASTDQYRIAIGTKNDTALTDEIAQSGGAAVTGLLPEGYAIRRTLSGGQDTYYVVGNDDTGAMYGALEIAESLRLNGFVPIADSLHNRQYEKRGLKMNVPMDARTPSYADGGDAAQAGIEDVWNINFWKELFDEMARNRFNFVSVWTLNAFPSMVKDVPGFENVDLDGPVKKLNLSTFDMRSWRCSNGTTVPCLMTNGGDDYQNSGSTMWSPSVMASNLMDLALGTAAPDTMDEKIQFWKDVMTYGKNRGIDFAMMTWNIFPAIAMGQYGMTDNRTDTVTLDYYKKAVKKLLDTYPLLMGLGWSSGENMSGTEAEKAQWITDTYGQGMKDHLATNPTRDFTAICRAWMGSMPDIKTKFTALGLTSANYANFKLDFSYKYAKARLYSRTAHTYHRSENFAATDNVFWELRNDDIYMVKWADPDFVRGYMQNFPRSGLGGPTGSTDPKTRGFHMGSDGFFWSRDFNSVNTTLKGQLQMKRRWAEYYLWGQLAYNPSLSNDHFKNVLRQRYSADLSSAQSDTLYTLWQKASSVIPKVNSYRWNDWDFQFYPEMNASKATGFHQVNNGTSWKQTSPSTTIGELNGIKTAIDTDIASIPTTTPELQYLVGDIKAMGHLAAYYADKIQAGVDYGTNNTAAATALTNARVHFADYRDTIKPQYGAKHIMGRVGFWDLDEIVNYHTCYDIKVANSSKVCNGTYP